MNARRQSATFSGLLSGGASGASVGSAAGPWGALIGGLAGAGLGAYGGNMAAGADEPFNELDLASSQLDLKDKQRQFKNSVMNDKGQEYFRKYLGSAFRGLRPTSFAEAMGQ